jgi:phthalate 4,5-dioxygenase
VPVDDENHLFFSFSVNRVGPMGNRQGRDGVPATAYRAPGNRANMHLQDRSAMKAGNWSGVQGVRAQDRAVTEAMGPITPRWREHLGMGDIAVSRFRHRMLDAVQAFMEGAEPPGLDANLDYADIHSEERMVPTEAPWQIALERRPLTPA